MAQAVELTGSQKLMLSAAKSMLGDLRVRVDRESQVVYLKQDEEVKEYTYEQLAVLAESLFPWS